jgi:aminoglycoside phosphotransferase (APT) family kinase protein
MNSASNPLPIFESDLITPVDMSTAIDLCPAKLGNKIYRLPASDRILKVGPTVTVAEADTMHLIRAHTKVPVPEVYSAYEKDGFGYIFMSEAKGRPLWTAWGSMTEKKKSYLIEQLSEYIRSWRNLPATFFGSVGHGPCQDVFFRHLPAIGNYQRTYGPYQTLEDYKNGLSEALENSCPTRLVNDNDRILWKNVVELIEGHPVFSHGDLYPDNILVDEDCKVTAILDWGASGFSIPERDFYESRSRVRHPIWKGIVESIFPEISLDSYKALHDFDQALVRYSGI